jgi:hypothetical protein
MGSIETEINGMNGYANAKVVPNVSVPQAKADFHYGPHKSNWVPVSEHYVFKPRKLRVVCVGAGYSGTQTLLPGGGVEIVVLTVNAFRTDVGV